MTRRLLALLLSSLAVPALAMLPATAMAQGSFPSKPIRIVVPFAPGGAADYLGRVVGERLAKAMGQPVIVDNRPGASGALGVGEVARAAPDGYTILLTGGDSLINNVALFKDLPYDPLKDFAYVTQIARSPGLLSANSSLPVKNMADLQALLAKQQGKMSYGSWGLGSLGHLAGEALNRKLKAGMVHVAQRGEAPVMADLLSKTVDLGITGVGLAKPQVLAGKITPLAIMGVERSAALPDVPTMREQGFDDPLFNASLWMAFLVPAKTPDAIVRRLSSEIRTIAATSEMRQLITDRGLELMNTTPEQFAANHRAEFDVIVKRMREFGIEAQ